MRVPSRMIAALFVTALLFSGLRAAETVAGRWSEDRANAWYAAQPCPIGANYLPHTAINQLEMWQADTFSPRVIDQELGWARGIGMNTMRVFLHDLLWEEDRDAFLDRMDQFLGIADRHHIKILFVFFDGVWDPHPYVGKQRPPRPFIHNSGWVQSPGREILRDPAQHARLKPYVQGVLRRFKTDPRILGWDLFNEPNNRNIDAYGGIEITDKPAAALVLLKEVYAWAREVDPAQPLTAGIWADYHGWKSNSEIHQFMLANADVITFHNYGPPDDMAREVTELQAAYHRPLICTEYMARGAHSTFDPILGNLRHAGVGALNWGLVNGKSQTIFPWDSWKVNYTAEPKLWHHDIFRADGTPYDGREVEYIRSIAAQK